MCELYANDLWWTLISTGYMDLMALLHLGYCEYRKRIANQTTIKFHMDMMGVLYCSCKEVKDCAMIVDILE